MAAMVGLEFFMVSQRDLNHCESLLFHSHHEQHGAIRFAHHNLKGNPVIEWDKGSMNCRQNAGFAWIDLDYSI
ncbi:hypothetical protein [Burkholderia alba]|uniref:hypothetical protein n=1 Tax=Burkholderia alba TaxID=2683677 RepID=UPI002B05A2EA|nr:hypothetical protein [Burkholderia alba]